MDEEKEELVEKEEIATEEAAVVPEGKMKEKQENLSNENEKKKQGNMPTGKVKEYNSNSSGKTQKKMSSKDFTKYMPYISLVIGIIIICLGASVMKKDPKLFYHESDNAVISSYSFGADYYTESYNAAYETVQKLNSVDEGLSMISLDMANFATDLNYVLGILIISIGLGTFGISLCFIRKSTVDNRLNE